ncbi:MAG: acetylxylan esterase [Armatimonadota bacterium]|nr:MAG: acetylxylan esterase [Armatimonadota bacterium]
MPKPSYDSEAHFQALYESVPRRFAFKAKTPAELKAWQGKFRPRLREALGVTNMQRDLAGHKPKAEKAEATDLGDYLREKWYLWTEPDVPLPFWLLVPKGATGRRPLVLTPHGHNDPDIYVGLPKNEQQKLSIAEGQRDIAVQAVREGYVTIAPTTRGFGETRTNRDREEDKGCSCRTELLHGLLVGRTAIGQRVWDISRLIDWAAKRDDVDGSRIAITGNSGGGTTSLFAGACETRITVAVPSCYFCTFAGSIGTIHHCDCNYVPGVMRLGEMYDVAGLIAPRAFCAIAGKDDGIFPIKHVREAFAQVKRVYEVAGVPERCRLYVGQGGHRYYSAGAWPFIKKWFGGKRW